MKYNLDSALVIVLRDAIKWESSEVTYAGTLTPLDGDGPIDPLSYQKRDRELAFRDLITASAIVETSIQVSDVWNFDAPRPLLQGPVIKDMPAAVPDQMHVYMGTTSQVRHVKNISIPIDAARYADSDLYGRDCLIYETLARASGSVFSDDMPVQRIDSQGVIFVGDEGTHAWSLAEGAPYRSDINASLPLSLDTFKQPDQNLADRDNQLAGYVAQMAQVLRNPFQHAMRLYVQVDAPTVAEQRESEVYTLESESTGTRTWVCEPALSLRNRIVYDISAQTLQWFRDDNDVHAPQIVAMTIPGITTGQTITTLPTIPSGKDCQYWRSKAGQVKPTGVQIIDTDVDIPYTGDVDIASDGILQPDSVSMLSPDHVKFTLPSSLAANQYRVSILIQPDPTVVILGNQNTTQTGGTAGGADFEANFVPADVLPIGYDFLVVGGAGVTYNAVDYLDGAVFPRLYNPPIDVQSYTYKPGVKSVVNQYKINFVLGLTPGPWSIQLGYTNHAGVSTGFGIKAQLIAQGQTPIDIIQDLIPVPFYGNNGDVLVTAQNNFDVPYLSEASVPDANIPIFWTYGDGTLSVRNIVLRQQTVNSTGSYAFLASLASKSSTAFITAETLLPEVVRFDFTTTAPTTSLDISWLNTASILDQNKYVPVKLKQVQVQRLSTYAATPMADEFQGWRQECIERAESVIRQSYDATVVAWGTNAPTFRGSGSYWGSVQSESWMSFIETAQPRVREVLSVPLTGYLVPGHQYEVTTAPVTYDGITYALGDRFYATAAGGADYTTGGLGVVKQVGAFIKSKPGHVGKPALMPYGLYFTEQGTVASYFDTPQSFPIIATCQPWMVDVGLYVAHSDFWMPERL